MAEAEPTVAERDEGIPVPHRRLHLTGVTKSFGGRKVVDIPDAELGTHRIEGLIGPNGAGKTTLMNLITHRVRLDAGRIVYHSNESDSIDIAGHSADGLARQGIVKSNQLISDFDSLTIRESMLLCLAEPAHERFFGLFKDRALREAAEEEIARYLEYFHFENPDGHAGSAGEKKLLDIIRCLLLKPSFLLLDEPTAGLPEDVTRRAMDLVARKTSQEGMSVLIVEHDLNLIWDVCQWVHFMSDGEMTIQGPPSEIRKSKTIAEKYLGTSDA